MSNIGRVGVGRFRYWPLRYSWLEPWMACEFPERPYEKGATGYHHRDDCHACAVAAEAAYRHVDDELRAWFEDCWDWLDDERSRGWGYASIVAAKDVMP